MKNKIIYLVVILTSLYPISSWAESPWDLRLTWESKQLTKSAFIHVVAADLNGNDTKELVVNDLGRWFGEVRLKEVIFEPGFLYNFLILEWNGDSLKTNWIRQWDRRKIRMRSREERDRLTSLKESEQIVAWKMGGSTIVETIPPNLSLVWGKDGYVLHEQYGSYDKDSPVRSYVFPFASPSCSKMFYGKESWPKECIVGMRDFLGKGEPKIVTIFEEKNAKTKKYKQTLRVRNFKPDFPIEWEKEIPIRLVVDPIDSFNFRATSGFLMRVFQKHSYYLFNREAKGESSYKLNKIKFDNTDKKTIQKGMLPDIYLRSTREKGIEEFWGYYLNDPFLSMGTFKSDYSSFKSELVQPDKHNNFLDIGHFIVEDIDDDGISEVIVLEHTGKAEYGVETAHYSQIKEYIHILKWDGKKYKTMWVSPPYKERGIKFIVDDIKNSGKKQLIVTTGRGTIQIWEIVK